MSRYFDLLGFGFFSCRFHSIQKDVTIVRKREEVGGGLLHWLEKVFFACCGEWGLPSNKKENTIKTS